MEGDWKCVRKGEERGKVKKKKKKKILRQKGEDVHLARFNYLGGDGHGLS